MSGFAALTRAAGNFLCVVCCFNAPKLNSNGEEKKDVFFCLLRNLWVFCVWEVPEFSSVLKTDAQASPANRQCQGMGEEGFSPCWCARPQFLSVPWEPGAQPRLQGRGKGKPCSSLHWHFYCQNSPQPREIWDLFCALGMLRRSCPLWAWRELEWGDLACFFGHFLGL